VIVFAETGLRLRVSSCCSASAREFKDQMEGRPTPCAAELTPKPTTRRPASYARADRRGSGSDTVVVVRFDAGNAARDGCAVLEQSLSDPAPASDKSSSLIICHHRRYL
jgi:hypothetical protein